MNKILALLILGSFLSSCVETTEQSGVLQDAVKALQKNDLGKFSSYLIGRASEQYGNRQGMDAIKRKLGNLGDLSTGKETLKQSWNGGSDTTHSLYNIEVLSKKKKILMAEVKCTSVTTSYEYEDCDYPDTPRHDPWPDHGNGGWDRPSPREPNEPNPPRYREPNPRPSEPNEPNPPRYKGRMIEGMTSEYSYGSPYCRTRTSYRTSTNCKISDLK